MASSTVLLHAAAWTLTFVLHATLLIAAAWLGLRFVKSPRLRERLWKVAFAGAFVTATASLLASDAGLSRGWALRTVEGLGVADGAPRQARDDARRPERPTTILEPAAGVPTDLAALGATAPETLEPAPRSSVPARLAPDAAVGPLVLPSNALAALVETTLGLAAEHAARRTTALVPATTATDELPRDLAGELSALGRRVPWGLVLAALWALGAALGLARWGLAWRGLVRRLADRRDVDDGRATRILDELVETAGVRPARLTCSVAIASPITLGVLRPEICIPERALAAEDGLRDEELRALLAHELAHVVRRDPAWLAFSALVERVFFFQPLLRLAALRWRDEAELCCDDWAARNTRDRLSLAACLTEVAGWIVREPKDLRAHGAALGMAASGAGLGRRVRRLLVPAPAREPRGAWIAPLSLLALGGVALAAPRVDAERHATFERATEVVPPALVRPVLVEPATAAPELVEPPQERAAVAQRERLPSAMPVEPPAPPPVEPAREPATDVRFESERVVGVRAPDAPLPAPGELDLAGELARLDRQLVLLSGEAAALRAELDGEDANERYGAAWVARARRRADSIVAAVVRLRAQRAKAERLLGLDQERAGVVVPADITGSRSGPQPSR